MDSSIFRTKFIAPLGFTYVNTDKLHDTIVNRHSQYAGLILTSQRSVEAIRITLYNHGEYLA